MRKMLVAGALFMNLPKLILAIAMLTVATLSWGADNRRDGNWWQGQDVLAKLNYMTGFVDGMELGKNFSYWKYINGTKAQQANVAQAIESYREYGQKYLSNVTVGQLSDGLDNFYADYKNRRILISNAVWLVANGIAGTPEDELNKMIESWRQNPGGD